MKREVAMSVKRVLFLGLSCCALITAVAQEPAELDYEFDVSVDYQTIDGFGAAYTWYSDWITQCDDRPKAYDALFSDGGMSLLRFKNEYEYARADYAGNGTTMLGYYREAAKRLAEKGEKPITLLSCWSPPKALKAGNDISGRASLRKNDDGSFCYAEYAAWWVESVRYYEGLGIDIGYVCIQNEVDFAAEYDGCRFEVTETSDCASFAQAYLAVYRAFRQAFGDDAPRMLGPETMSCVPGTIFAYMKPILEAEPASVWGIAHHLYVGGEADGKTNEVEPGSYIDRFMGLCNSFGDWHRWQTEFYIGHALDTATLINYCLVYERANAYIYWSCVWADESPTFENGMLLAIKHGRQNWTTANGWRLCADYYALRHFSQFIRPGYVRVKGLSMDAKIANSAYRNADASRVVLVLINQDEAARSYRLVGRNYEIRSSQAYQSTFGEDCPSEANCFVDIGSALSGGGLILPPKSVTTVVLTGAPLAVEAEEK